MKLTRFQKDFLEKTELFLNKNNLIEDEHYSVFFNEIVDLKTRNNEIKLLLQLKNDKEVVKQLKNIGWNIEHKYYSDGQVSLYSNRDLKNDYGNIEMIQLSY
ncbi:hypothetical protein [uncultured Clostridium sp.]|uniref:hypothetical protein n=1 Tax=uncultured Clostridium sp. TaxID=59620 RepID=UPI0028EA5FC7|nr:hypothetical protein [uncultured Clostridium sp.]